MIHNAIITILLVFSAAVCFAPTFREAFFRLVKRHMLLSILVAAGFLTALEVMGLNGLFRSLPMVLDIIIQFLIAILFMGVQFWAMMYFMSRPRMYWVMPGENGTTFADYKGNPEVLEQARRAVSVLRGVKDFKQMGGEITRGVLLSGPPGTGKSYLAQCIANEAGVPFAYCSSASLQSAFLGMGAMTIWRLYGKARKLTKEWGAVIIFLDELDAIGSSRSGSNNSMMGGAGMFMGGGSGILNELLMQMDPPSMDNSWTQKLWRSLGMNKKTSRPAILTIGATNLVEALDPALKRPGRFDISIAVNPPSTEGRREVLDYYLAKIKNEVDTTQFNRLVFDTIGYTPVAIKHVINQAVSQAFFAGRETVTYEDITKARLDHEMGIAQPLSLTDTDKRRIAYHEAGHAVVGVLVRTGLRTARATIVPRGGALGMVMSKPDQESHTKTAADYLADIDVCLASRAVEELLLNTKMSGFYGDLSQATATAAAMIGQFGMGERLVSLSVLGIQPSSELMVAEVDKLLKVRMEQTKLLIERAKPAVHAVAEALLERLELDGPEVERLVYEALDREQVELTAEELEQKTAHLTAFGTFDTGSENTAGIITPAQQPAWHELDALIYEGSEG